MPTYPHLRQHNPIQMMTMFHSKYSHSGKAQPMKALLLFDIDGTILRLKDYRSYHIICDFFRNRFSATIDPNELLSFSGKTDLQILRETCQVCGIDFADIEDNIDSVWSELNSEFVRHCTPSNIQLLPGVIDLLSALDSDERFQLALVTGNFTANAYLKLSTFNLEKYFPFGAFGSDNADRNSLPMLAIERGNSQAGKDLFSPRNSIIIGDSHLDVACAKANGIPCLAVATGRHSAGELSSLGADCVLNNFISTEETLNSINNLLCAGVHPETT
jgi:phosphoglycolate phosphatase-like HAD superfamily hydrolase